MRTVHTEVGVMAPADVVWQVLTDFDGWARWNPIMKLAGVAREGARIEAVLAPPGRKPVKTRPVIVRVDEGHELLWHVRTMVPGILDAEHGFRVTPEDVGRCRFEQFETFSGLFANAIVGRAEGALKTGFTAMNRALKREAERLARERA